MRIFLIAACLICKFIAISQIDKSTIAYYNFDDCNVKDFIGSGNTASVTGNPQCVCGVKEKGLRFDGVSDEIFIIGSIGNNFQNADFTLSFYFKPSIQLGNQVIFSKREDCTDDNAFSVNYSVSSNTLSVLISETSADKIVLTNKMDKNVCWQHVVISRKNRNHYLYVNGKLVDEQVSTKRLKIGNNDPFTIAQGPCPTQLKFKGDLDEIYVYNRAIDPAIIEKLNLKPDNIANFDTLIYLGGQVPIKTTQSCASSFAWKPAAGAADPTSATTTLSPTSTTTYTLQFNVDGCIASDTILIKVVDPSLVPCDLVYLPKAFTPNGDGLNETFGISNPFVIKSIKTFEIYDSWGGKIFGTGDVFERWDGSFNGSPVTPGVYLYRVIFDCNGVEKAQQGSVTILK
ncbi:MAG: gliding motility-associated C-terminal domain-containing protein [Saprospiraceae bacterium]|jgi:gliding motility-associated-like protein|nr:gliding motility-associated C-terminal domain-containing protein [Saprospiraceae bacterium]